MWIVGCSSNGYESAQNVTKIQYSLHSKIYGAVDFLLNIWPLILLKKFM